MENVVIIGGGPAGLAAALYTARAGLSPLVFGGSPPGGQLTLTSEIENYLGFESILGSELIEKFRNHAKKFGAKIIDENVVKVDFLKRPFEVYLAESSASNFFSSSGSPVSASGSPASQVAKKLIPSLVKTKSVIIATGGRAVWLGLESEKRLRGKGVSVCATCDGFFFKNKKVAIVGGGDTALEEALTLTRFAEKVYIIHRRDQFKASKIMQKKVFNNKKIEVIWNGAVEEILGEKKVEGIKLKILNSKFKIIPVEGVFVAIGYQPDTELFLNQIELDKGGHIITSAQFGLELAKIKNQISLQLRSGQARVKNNFDFQYQAMTSVPGVFAAGDCVDHLYRQASYAMGMGVGAALEVERWLSS